MRTLELNINEYPGGVGIWSSTPAIINSSSQYDPASEKGLHVHARKTPGGKKQIDQTFEEVTVLIHQDAYSLSGNEVEFWRVITLSQSLNFKIPISQKMLDGYEKIESLRQHLQLSSMRPQRVVRECPNLDSYDGFMIIACSPAIIWTGQRVEESGVHVHAFKGEKLALDATFSSARVYDLKITPQMALFIDLQKSLQNLC